MPNMTVTRSRSIVRSTDVPSSSSGMLTVPPTNSVGSTVTPRPPIRVKGADAIVTSAELSAHAAAICTTFQRRFDSVSITPLGAPVLPEV